ncbi:hypothetical protein N7532_006829 [Penicillium argentinense]|uniref:DNA-directed RNA polymerase III subunit n=1 Tax=Penicillium argentinense TaxID=1131581 RepID=A0A9W9FGM5_9EURO|nr:uncharacterized protein N7532_006829 [Penicillium argentinense]KAJ5099828.1 hypothetical protein N7532_006829 [Penicillium argentinense]
MLSKRKKLRQAYVVPLRRKLTQTEQNHTDWYRSLRERYQDGPYYAVLDSSSTSAKKGSAARVNFDPFHGMPSYSRRYQKKRRTIPKIADVRDYETQFFPRELWQTIKPDFRPDAPVDGYKPKMASFGMKRGFEDDEDDAAQAPKGENDEEDYEENEAEGDEGGLLEGDEVEEEISDNDYEDDEDDMGGDYNAEQYFDDGGDDMGDDGGDGGGEDEI